MARSLSRSSARALWNLLQPLLTIAVLILVWEGSVRVFDVAAFLLPPPSSVYKVFVANAGLLWTHNLVTLLEIILGFGAALIGGVAIGVALGTFRPLERALMPVILFFQVVPKSALAPLLIVWAGVGMYSKIALVFLMCFFPIVVQVVAGVRSVNEELVFLGRSTAARKRFSAASRKRPAPPATTSCRSCGTTAVAAADRPAPPRDFSPGSLRTTDGSFRLIAGQISRRRNAPRCPPVRPYAFTFHCPRVHHRNPPGPL
ncbi:MAG: ABC transporter permease, partial [Rhodanobacter sp.]